MTRFIRAHVVGDATNQPALLNTSAILSVARTESGGARIYTADAVAWSVDPFECVAAQIEEPRFVRLPCVCDDGTLGALWIRPESIICVDEGRTPDGHAVVAVLGAGGLEPILVALPASDVRALLGAGCSR